MGSGSNISKPEWLLPLGMLLLATGVSWVVFPLDPARSRVPHLLLLASFVLFAFSARPSRDSAAAWSRARIYLVLGCVYALFHQSFPANELAGILLLFLPLAMTMVMATATATATPLVSSLPLPGAPSHQGSGKSVVRAHLLMVLQAVAFTTLFSGLLALTLSRAGYLALAPVVGWILLASGRWGRLVLAAMATGSIALLAISGPDELLEFFVFDGKLQQLSWESWLTGRPHIWSRALEACFDAPLLGLGLQAAGPASAHLYPYTHFDPREAFDDVHNLYLQTYLDLGFFGGLAFAILLLAAAQRLWLGWSGSPSGSSLRFLVLGIGGSLAAFLLFGMFDAVALGTLGNIPFWSLLGLCFALPGRAAFPLAQHRRAVLAPVLVAALLSPVFFRAWRINHATLLAAQTLMSNPGQLEAARSTLEDLVPTRCRAGWLAGLVANGQQHIGDRNRLWSQLLQCSPHFIAMMERVAPDARALAANAAEHQPGSADAHFWLARLARLAARDAPDGNHDSISHYRRGLALRPTADREWQELGQQLTKSDPDAARAAFERSCQLLDTNGQGCLPAGMLAERAGDLAAAIRLYRRSRVPVTNAWARNLELRILSAESPPLPDVNP